ncbi:chemotaxis protein [Rhizobium sp. KVB221]|uniref:Chemotaxis protein n=1 Tax=Rhizobium setariae TaxID=2801340 RepID=A0A936YRD7_9HYPH|nr:methyl-accepting chemotaxis protein [Rhizobium setariae]MBL0375328.1 chemotaxis protein [Rhizobium setariae]
MLKRNISTAVYLPVDRSGLDGKLAAAHSRLEKKFLEGGTVLIAIVDILKRLIGSLDELTGALDGQTSNDTIARIQATAKQLAELPGFELTRKGRFESLFGACRTMQSSVDDMRDTMRYLRTFAITVKITGAGLAEFAGFADEIRERIQSGAQEVDRFSVQLAAMHSQLARAQSFSGEISQNYVDTVPTIVRELERDAGKVAEHHRNLVKIANEVKALARGVQGKIATVLSALQIGDITRQRIEHIRSSFEIFDEFRNSAEGAALGEDALARFDGAINHLAAAQMDETLSDFQRECRKVMENMSRFVDDTRDILALRDQMHRQSDSEGRNFLSGLEQNVARASALVSDVQDTSTEADTVAQSTGETAQSLIQGIEIIRSIKTDIHYMALNSNLRCSKLGDEGRSVNVVSGELRVFAEKLEDPANAVLAELKHFEAAAESLSQDRGVAGRNISQPMNEALGSIREVSARMDEGIAAFEREGQEVFSKISAAIGTLDFEHELGDVLQDCLETSWSIADLSDSDVSALGEEIGAASQRIFKLYTMASERDIHRRFLPVAAAAEAAPKAVAVNDDELFEDALF